MCTYTCVKKSSFSYVAVLYADQGYLKTMHLIIGTSKSKSNNEIMYNSFIHFHA